MTFPKHQEVATTSGEPPMVLHVRVVTSTGGGPEKTILNSPRFLQHLGYQSLCVFLHPPEDPGILEIAVRGARAENEIIGIPDRGPLEWRSIRDLLRICRRHRVAIWHGHDYKSNAIGLLLRRFYKMHLVTTAHGWTAGPGRVSWYERLDLRMLPYYQRIICVSREIADRCRAAGARDDRLTVIENAIDLEQYRHRSFPREDRRASGFPDQDILIAAVGRLSPEKGFDRLIRAVADIVDRGVDIGLAIAGEGPSRPELETLIAAQPDPGRFRLLRHVSELESLYSAANIFALSSIREGLPNVLLEAMAMSLPVVATCVGGVPQLIQHEETGLLVAPDDASALAGAIERLIADPALSSRIAQAGRQLMEDRYSFARRMEKIAAVYESLDARRAVPSGNRP